MGLDVMVRGAREIGEAMADLPDCQIVIVDGNLVSPADAPPLRWNELRLRSPAGMVTVKRRGEMVAVVVFGNAGAELIATQQRVAAAFAATP